MNKLDTTAFVPASVHERNGRRCDGTAGDTFGWSVAVAGDRIVVGAPRDDDNGTNSGSAYVFEVADTDTTAPTLSVPGPITVEASSPDGAVVEFTVTATDDTDSDQAWSVSPHPGRSSRSATPS